MGSRFEQELVTDGEIGLPPPLPSWNQLEIHRMMVCAPKGPSEESGCSGLGSARLHWEERM